jgi:hypothetical protein
MASCRSLCRAIARPAPSRFLHATQARAISSTPRLLSDQPQKDLEVGELQGAKFKIEPLRRVGEDDGTKRARLICTFPPPPPLKKPLSSSETREGKKRK